MWLEYAGAASFALIGFFGVLVTPLGIPAAWVMIGIAAIADGASMMWGDGPLPFGLPTLFIAAAAALLGELLEFLAGASGAKAGGASRSGVIGSMVGGLVGVIAGTVFVPAPLIGSIGGALFGVAAGAMAGEMIFRSRTIRDAVRPAIGAAVGRVLGSLVKLPCALITWIVLVRDAFVSA